MHVHASDKRLTESCSAKFFVRKDGSAVIKERGKLNDRELRGICGFIQENYKEMYRKWAAMSDRGFYEK